MVSLVNVIAMATAVIAVLPGNNAMTTPATWTKPWFCHANDCPEYTVLSTNSMYEVRQYKPSVWVATNITVPSFQQGVSQPLFWKLFSYISSKNSMGMKIPMTTPVVTEVMTVNGQDEVTMHFMIPHNLQSNPPAPTDSTVYIRQIPDLKVYVKGFPGYDNVMMDKTMLATLKSEINDPSMYSDNPFLKAGYDGPYTFSNRHNEVWLMAAN